VSALRRVFVVVAALVFGAVACGIPSDDEPRAIPEAAVPEQAREPRGSGTSSTTALPSAQTQDQMIYLVGGSTEQPRLVAVSVPVPVHTDASRLAQATIQQLIGTQPEDVGRSGEVTNQIPSSVQVLGATVGADGVLELNLTDALSQVESARLRLAIAQIVFTATELRSSGINSVRVLINGQAASVPTQGGSADAGQPVSRADYPDLDPQLQPPAE
jgi:spore germination protein GerM